MDTWTKSLAFFFSARCVRYIHGSVSFGCHLPTIVFFGKPIEEKVHLSLRKKLEQLCWFELVPVRQACPKQISALHVFGYTKSQEEILMEVQTDKIKRLAISSQESQDE